MPAPGAERISSRPPQLARALLHRGQAEVARAELGPVGVEPDPVVGDLDRRARRRARPTRTVTCSARAWRTALWSASWAIRSSASSRSPPASIRGVRRRPRARSSTPCMRLEHLDLLAQRALEPVALELGRAQAEDQRAQLVERLARELAQPLDLGARRDRVAVELRGGGLGGQHQAEQLLADDVVQLEREAVALGEDRQLAALLVQARVGDRDRRRAPPAARSAPGPRRRTRRRPPSRSGRRRR